jgi:hypothetical protein
MSVSAERVVFVKLRGKATQSKSAGVKKGLETKLRGTSDL